jgi:hypothetical protein
MVATGMGDATDITGVAALLADSSRSAMLQALMDQLDVSALVKR